ncbi:CDP-alcohol phosphatidyltransferase family protein [Lignipirellula cremea]|uniref:CDP-diacylglycerol--glycerol-3-phosphate 3-phosphatidyltransferase n=1 Tax=Lignipirellula cremea TaxID=2528010 RepID=A0A518DWW6_9BACT|nr:CDP-alcohol phosphatidyltransferase family protein [Lignipirellula cremea]QDU96314.1 CDP-diacylglycerol--glycerol-3-phosphate 3-phosphatidyltransferase [Lignipirellula cremea]
MSTAEPRPPSLLNLPNLLCAVRLAGSPVLVLLALENLTQAFFVLLICLLATDWIDGKLAILWKQQTAFGARLDTVADVALYAAMLFGLLWMRGDLLRNEWAWLLAVPVTYGVSVTASWWKFGRFPSYHTRAAKTCWLLTSIAAICIFGGWGVWPLRVAAVAVALTNLEATAITAVLTQRRSNVVSVYHAWRAEQKAAPAEESKPTE